MHAVHVIIFVGSVTNDVKHGHVTNMFDLLSNVSADPAHGDIHSDYLVLQHT